MMFITSFHRLIRNKMVWGGFAVLVVISFVWWGTATRGSGTNSDRTIAGILDGKPVKSAEYQQAYFNTYLSMAMMMGRPLDINRQMDAAFRKMAWRRVATLRAAEAMGLAISDEELAAAIQRQPFFVENGKFNPQRFSMFVTKVLPTMQANQAQFEECMREEMLINKVRNAISSLVWIPPIEVQYVFHQLYDTFTLGYVELKTADFESQVTITPKDAEDYFQSHLSDFEIPEQMTVKYVAFPLEDYIDLGSIEPEAMRDYYYDNLSEFTRTGATKEEEDGTLPFDEVEEEVRLKIAREAAVAAAMDDATELVVRLAPDRDGNAPSFEESAEEIGFPALTSGVFSATDRIPGLSVGRNATKAAFELSPTPDDYFSRPLLGEDAVYVLAYATRADKRMPKFKEVREKVVARARTDAATKAMLRKAEEISAAARAALDAGKSFQDAMTSLNVTPKITQPFNVATGMEKDDSGVLYFLIRHVLSLNKGEVSQVVRSRDGAYVACVLGREPADPATLGSVRDELISYLKKRRADLIFSKWQQAMLEPGRFQDRLSRRAPAEPAADTNDEDDEESGQEVQPQNDQRTEAHPELPHGTANSD